MFLHRSLSLRPGFATFVALCRTIGVVLLVSFLATGIGSRISALEAADDVFERQQQRIETIARISPSVVCVMPPNGQGGGSGVLISADGYAISNYHVTSGSGNFMKCGLNDGKVYDAVIVGIDPTGDVALIKLLGREDFPFCTPGDSDLVKAGDEVLALGNPFLLASDFSPTVTFGIVSGVQRYQYPAGSFLEYTDCIQIDASINPGNSGGPLFDIQGRWIGINGRASFEKRGRINSGAAYAISVRQVLLFVDHLKSGRIVDHGRTDFTVSTYDDVVQVEQVSELSEAWRRGLRVGDEVLSFGGRALSNANDFKNIMGIYPNGSRVPLVFRNDEGVHRVTVRLLPLHEFGAAPKLPEERRPEGEPKPGDPEGPPDEHPHEKEEAPQVPEQYAHLFEQKENFANAWFNKLHTDQVLEPLRKLLSKNSAAETWVLKVAATSNAGQHVGEISVSAKGAGLDLAGLAPQLQLASQLEVQNESPELYGLLSGVLQWYRLFQNDVQSFSEVTYVGAERQAEANGKAHILLVRDGAITSRWYFTAGSPLPVGVDVNIGAGVDECRLRFDEWRSVGERPVPGRIGVIDNQTGLIRWIEVDSLDVKSVSDQAAAMQSNGVLS